LEDNNCHAYEYKSAVLEKVQHLGTQKYNRPVTGPHTNNKEDDVRELKVQVQRYTMLHVTHWDSC